jgi:hypothetical protein
MEKYIGRTPNIWKEEKRLDKTENNMGALNQAHVPITMKQIFLSIHIFTRDPDFVLHGTAQTHGKLAAGSTIKYNINCVGSRAIVCLP